MVFTACSTAHCTAQCVFIQIVCIFSFTWTIFPFDFFYAQISVKYTCDFHIKLKRIKCKCWNHEFVRFHYNWFDIFERKLLKTRNLRGIFYFPPNSRRLNGKIPFLHSVRILMEEKKIQWSNDNSNTFLKKLKAKYSYDLP